MTDARREFDHLFKCLTPTCRLYFKLASSVNHVLCKSRLILSRVNGPIIVLPTLEGFRKMTEDLNEGRENDVLCPCIDVQRHFHAVFDTPFFNPNLSLFH